MDLKSEINHHLYSLWLEPEPTDDPDEKHRRHEVLGAAGQLALAAAAESPNGEPSPPRKRAILAAMMTYGRARLAGEQVEFDVHRSSNGKFAALPAWMAEMMYQSTLGRLQSGWDEAPVRPVMGDRVVSDDGRFGEAQLRGIQRRFDTEGKRIAAIQEAACDLAHAGIAILPEYEVSEKKARAWLRDLEKPSAIADEMLADYVNNVARNAGTITDRYNDTVGQRFPDKAEELKIVPPAKNPLKPNITARWVKSTAQRGRETLVHLRRQDEGLKRIESEGSISQTPTALPDEPSGD